jgi:hypothetical protein
LSPFKTILEISRGLLSEPVRDPTSSPALKEKWSQPSIACPPRSMANCQSPEILAAVAAGSDTGSGRRTGGGDDAQASQQRNPAAISVR